ncbi:hypothetical protein BQ8794_200188 [Mesorhizobium prunaredense]|uniref:Uncharacterized protein n=1 Tax=Mesorhizobium prunaredense TaxID=1631249 RepID=A0A1R3V5K1_9HYPH|nr:hypothetical protein BQ8794_200188 [Mesorhizobium prunaredense]
MSFGTLLRRGCCEQSLRSALPLIALPGISPRIVTGRKDAFAKDFVNLKRRRKGAKVAASSFSLSLYGEKMPTGR